MKAPPAHVVISANGDARVLTPKVAPPEDVQESRVKDTSYLMRLLMRILSDIARLFSRWQPRTIDYEDRLVGTGTYEAFQHGLGGRVRWWIIDKAGAEPSLLRDYPDERSDSNTLVLYSYTEALITLRIEEVG